MPLGDYGYPDNQYPDLGTSGLGKSAGAYSDPTPDWRQSDMSRHWTMASSTQVGTDPVPPMLDTQVQVSFIGATCPVTAQAWQISSCAKHWCRHLP